MSLNRKVFSNISKYPNGGGPVKKWGFLDSGKGKEEVVVGGGLNFPTGTGINAIGVISKNQNQVFKGVGSLGVTQQINPNFNLGVKFDKTFLDVGTKLPVFSNIQPSVTAKYTIPYKKKKYSGKLLKEGGEIKNLTDKEIQAYRDGGYVVEEYHEGGAVHKHPHAPYDRYLDNSNVAVSDNTQPHNYYPAPKIPKVTPPNFVTDKAFPITSNTKKYPKSTLIEKDNSKIKQFVDENKRYLGQVYGDDLYNENGSYNYKKLASTNDLGKIVEDAKYAEFSKNEQEAYDAAPFYEKAANAVTATMADPMLTIRNAIFEGKGPMMGQWKGLNDEGNENERFYKNATGYDDDWLNSGFNFINPLAYTGEAALANNAFDAGLNLTDALTMGSVSGLIKPLTSYKKFSKSRALKSKAKKRATALDKKIELIELKKIKEANDAFELASKAIVKRIELEKEINKQAGAYYKKAKSPENMKRAAAHDAEYGTEYVKSLDALQADKIGYMNSFNIKIKPNPKDGTAGTAGLSEDAISHNKMVEYAKNSKTIDQKFAPKELKNGIKDREIIVYDDMELSDVKRVINHELKHHWTMPNEAKNYDNLILEGGLESPAEISKFNPQLADDLIQPAFPLRKAENQSAYEYYSSGREVDAYVNTNLRDELVDAGILKNHWDDLDDTKLATYLMGKPSKHSKKYIDMAGKDFVKNFNKGVYVVAPVVGLGLGVNEALKNETKGQSYKFDDGGEIKHLTEAEIKKYRDGGYIVEEY